MKVTVNRDFCEGAGMCALEAPEVFEMDADETLVIKQPEVSPEQLPAVEAAVIGCPTQALSLSE